MKKKYDIKILGVYNFGIFKHVILCMYSYCFKYEFCIDRENGNIYLNKSNDNLISIEEMQACIKKIKEVVK